MRILAVLLSILLCHSTLTHAEWVSSAQYRAWLEEVNKTNGAFNDRAMALAYTQGVFDVLDGQEICAPQQMQGRVLLLTLRDWMIRNPDRIEPGAAATIRTALTHIYGCKEEPRQ